jgi:hypothetical protein
MLPKTNNSNFTGEAKTDATTQNSTHYYLYHGAADDALIGNMIHKAFSLARLFAAELTTLLLHSEQ